MLVSQENTCVGVCFKNTFFNKTAQAAVSDHNHSTGESSEFLEQLFLKTTMNDSSKSKVKTIIFMTIVFFKKFH